VSAASSDHTEQCSAASVDGLVFINQRSVEDCDSLFDVVTSFVALDNMHFYQALLVARSFIQMLIALATPISITSSRSHFECPVLL
jgi:hypothetical protein